MAFDLGNSAKTALLVMDLQNDVVNPDSKIAQKLGFAKAVEESGVLNNIKRLLEAFRAAKLPVIHVVVDFSESKAFQKPHRGQFIKAIESFGPMLEKDSWGGQIHDDFMPGPDEPVIRKPFFSAFSGTKLHEVLRARDISQLILTGVTTDFVIDSTSWSASDLGYDVIVPRDACVCADSDTHENAIKRLAARADITDTASIVEAIS
jgi:nicotinamidase-related amidase